MSFYDDASLIMYPSGYKANKIYSLKPTDGSGDFDFTRASTATRVNADGLIESVATGVPRIDYTGGGCGKLLLEPQRTNQWHNSNDFTQSSWIPTNVTISSSSEISPDGTLNAYKITDDSTNGEHRIRGNSLFIPSGANFSIFAKAAEYGNFAIANLSDGFTINFDLINGTIVSVGSGWSDAKIENYGNGWYRCSGSVSINKICGYALLNDSGDFVFSGDGTKGVNVWGAQFEDNSSYPTSYIPTTTTSAVTRAAETANGAGDVNTFNDSEGVLMIEISRLNEAQVSSDIISINDGSLSNYITLYYDSSGVIYTINFGTTERSGNFPMSSKNQSNFNKIALKYKNQNISLFVNGVEVDTNTGTLGLSGLNSLDFNHGNGAFNFYGNTRQIQYFPSVLTDAKLEEITSWTSFIEMAQAQNYKTY